MAQQSDANATPRPRALLGCLAVPGCIVSALVLLFFVWVVEQETEPHLHPGNVPSGAFAGTWKLTDRGDCSLGPVPAGLDVLTFELTLLQPGWAEVERPDELPLASGLPIAGVLVSPLGRANFVVREGASVSHRLELAEGAGPTSAWPGDFTVMMAGGASWPSRDALIVCFSPDPEHAGVSCYPATFQRP